MMFVRSTLLAAGALLISGPAMAQESDSAEAADVDASNRIVCQRVAPPSGSRIGARNICKTEREWEQIGRETRNRLDEAFNRSKVYTGG